MVARDAARLSQRRSRRDRARLPGVLGQHPPDEIASEEVARQAHDLYRAVLTKARDQHGLSYSAAGTLPLPRQSRRRALSVVRAARCRRRRRCVRAAYARRADGGTLRGLQARGGGALLRRALPPLPAADRAGRCAARAARGPRRLRGYPAGARRHARQLPLRPWRAHCPAVQWPAHRQGAVRRHQGRSCAGGAARSSRGAATQHGGVPGARRDGEQRPDGGHGASLRSSRPRRIRRRSTATRCRS